jgi:hypothetical protein
MHSAIELERNLVVFFLRLSIHAMVKLQLSSLAESKCSIIPNFLF